MARLSEKEWANITALPSKLRSLIRGAGPIIPSDAALMMGMAADAIEWVLAEHADRADLSAEAATLRAEVARLRGVVDTMAKAARFASSEVRRAAAMPGNSLYGLCNVAVNLDASLDAALAEHDAGRAADGPGDGQRGG